MGIYYQAAVVVGLPYDELCEKFKDDEALDEMIDNGDIRVWTCYYDAGRDESLIGCNVIFTDDYSWEPLHLDKMAKQIELAKQRWKNRFPNIDPGVYITVHGY